MRKRKREDHLRAILENELADPTQIDDMMSMSSARSQSRNLRGTSSSSASGSIATLRPAKASSESTASGPHMSASSGSSGTTEDIPFEEVDPIQLDIKMDALQKATDQHILKLQQTSGNNTEIERLEKILTAIANIRSKMRKKEQTPSVLREYSRLKGILIATLNEAQ
jgi:hypothetical protein